MTQLRAELGRHRLEPSPPSSAKASGMETSEPRAGNQLTPTPPRHSLSFGAELPRMSSRDQLAEMAASTQGKDEHARRRRRGSRLPRLRKPEAPQPGRAPPGALTAQGRGGRPGFAPVPAVPRVRPRSGARQGLIGRGVASCWAQTSGAAPKT